MKAYDLDKKKGWVEMVLREDRALWRDSATLFELGRQRQTSSHHPPSTLGWITEAALANIVPRSTMYQLVLVGVASDRASVLLWRHEQLPLPVGYLHDAALLANLQTALSTAETVGETLRDAVWHCVRQFLHPGETGKLSKQQSHEVSAMADGLAPLRHYWPRLETHFLALLQALPAPADASPEEDQAHRRARLAHWFYRVLRPTARRAYGATSGRMDNTARALRAVVLGRQKLERALGRIASQPPFDESPDQQTDDTKETANAATGS